MNDMIGQAVESGNYLIDDRGKLWQGLPTDRTYQVERIVLVQERRRNGSLGQGRYLHLPHALLATEGLCSASPQRRKAEWQQVYEHYIRPRKKEEIRKRREKVGSSRNILP